MSDRLAEIKAATMYCHADHDWLIAKVERLEARAVERVKFEDALVDKTLERAAVIAKSKCDCTCVVGACGACLAAIAIRADKR